MDAIYHFIFEHGSGNVSADLAFVALALVVVGQALFLSVLSRKVAELQSIAKLWEKSSQAGKLQKLEDLVLQFRTEVMRSLSGKGPTPPDLESTEKKTHELVERALTEQHLEQLSAQNQQAQDPKLDLAIPSEAPEAAPAHEAERRAGGVFRGLARTRNALLDKIKSVFSSSPTLSKENVEELEAQLIGADLGVALSEKLLEELKSDVKDGKVLEQSAVLQTLKSKVEKILLNGGAPNPEIKPVKAAESALVIMMVGVNGAGKTTTSAKLAHRFKQEGYSPLLVAADTFRAAAVDQLKSWADRLQIPIIMGPENCKPATVVFEAMERAKKGDIDVVIVDTAGRLHTQSNLMNELSGVRNAISRHIADAPQEVLLVVDGSSGQNAIAQAREFQQATGLTGVIVTKLDGTPKGGSVVAIKSELGIPVRYIGVGETPEDLQVFDAKEFSTALLGTESEQQLSVG